MYTMQIYIHMYVCTLYMYVHDMYIHIYTLSRYMYTSYA